MKKTFKKYFFPFLAVFFALALLIRPQSVLTAFGRLWNAVLPVFLGILFAAVADPAVCAFERGMGKLFRRYRGDRLRYIAIAEVYIIVIAVIVTVVWIVIPRLIESAALFANSIDGYYVSFKEHFDSAAENDALGLLPRLDKLLENLSDKLPELFDKTFTATAEFFKGAANAAVGAVLSVYILAEKVRLTDFIKSAAEAAMSGKTYRRAARIINAVSKSLVSFIGGQLAEAVVLGSLCFAGMVIFGFEYPLLISTMIGVTALVPVVGAFMGAVPSALVLFLVKPSSALWFIVFIIVLQQLENNLIYPKLVGKSVGMPPLLILIAIIAGAEIGGAWGIMLGIPLLSAAYMLIREKIESGRDSV